MDALFRLGEGNVSDVLERIDDAPSYNSIRKILGILEQKGLVVHHRESGKYIYRSKVSTERTAPAILDSLVTTFFRGSTTRAVAALLDSSSRISDVEYQELSDLLAEAHNKERLE